MRVSDGWQAEVVFYTKYKCQVYRRDAEAQRFIRVFVGAALAANHLADRGKFAAKAAPTNNKKTLRLCGKKIVLNRAGFSIFAGSYRQVNNHQEHDAADDRDQAAKAHQAHAGNLFKLLQALLGARGFSLHAITA